MPLEIDPAQGIIDELQGWYLAKAQHEGVVYAKVIRLLVGELYMDRDYLARRMAEGKHTSYDYTVEQRLLAVAWAIRQLVLLVPSELKELPEPPRPPRPPSVRHPRGTVKKNVPSWNGQPKKNWAGPDLPPPGFAPTPKPAQTKKEPQTNR